MKRLKDKVTVITGGAGGMGRTHSKKFIEEGAKVVVADLDTSDGKEFVEELGENARFIALDVTDEKSWENLIQETEEVFGPIEVLVNNAGIVASKSFKDTTYDEYLETIRINQDGVFLGLKHIYPSMKKADKGSIINISSINGIVGSKNNSAYVASKFAVRGLTKAAAAEYAEDNIRVNSVHPGVIRTPMTDQEDVQELIQPIIKRTPMQRLAEPEEITELVLFLASDASSFSTASEFVADGGLIEIQ